MKNINGYNILNTLVINIKQIVLSCKYMYIITIIRGLQTPLNFDLKQKLFTLNTVHARLY